jgi:hypothetical protein
MFIEKLDNFESQKINEGSKGRIKIKNWRAEYY